MITHKVPRPTGISDILRQVGDIRISQVSVFLEELHPFLEKLPTPGFIASDLIISEQGSKCVQLLPLMNGSGNNNQEDKKMARARERGQ